MSSQRKTNAWGHAIPTPHAAFSNPALRPFVERLIVDVTGAIGFGRMQASQFIECFFALANEQTDVIGFETALKAAIRKEIDEVRLKCAIAQRSQVVCEHIAPFLDGKTLLDIGCGNGLIAQQVSSRFQEIQLLDVVCYVDAQIKLPFKSYAEGKEFPLTKPFDSVLLLTVLHHSNDPLGLLRKAWSFTSRRLLIIESVFGVFESEEDAPYCLTSLSESDQIEFAVLVDWLYNRVLHDDIPVPYNFTTPSNWLRIFAREGMRVSHSKSLGQDILLAPELHHLFVLEK